MIDYLELINADHPIQEYDRPKQLVQAPFAKPGLLIEPEVAKQLKQLITTTKLTGKIIVTDAYRTKETQEEIWHSTIKERGELFTKKYVAKPGCSEHELGLAVDLGLSHLVNDYIQPSFSEGVVVDTFLEKIGEFGFILRYPKGKEKITGISFEPWHFRYVGVPHSRIIIEKDLTLEEYLEQLSENVGISHES